MAVSASWYGNGIAGLLSATAARQIDWDGDEIRTSLHTSTYVPDKDAHDYWDDATNEVSGSGYTTPGFTNTTSAVSIDSASDEVRMDMDDSIWSSASFTARIAVVYHNSAGATSTDPLLSYVDFGGDETVSSGTFTITWDSTGVMKIDYT